MNEQTPISETGTLFRLIRFSLFVFSGSCFGTLLLTAAGKAVSYQVLLMAGIICLIAPAFLSKHPPLLSFSVPRILYAAIGALTLSAGAYLYITRVWKMDSEALIRTSLYAVGGLYFIFDVILMLPRLLPGKPRTAAATDKRTSPREKAAAFLFCLLVGYLMVGICSRSSPLYPLNDWVDANCFFTTGKAFFNGKVVYRDIYEQKGILLYFIYGIGYLIDHTGFFGVYLLEGLSFGCFLFIAYLIGRLYAGRLASAVGVPMIGYLVMASAAIRQGGGAEQFTLPVLLLPIYLFLDAAKHGERDGIPTVKKVFLLGIGAAAALWVKFTFLGVYIGYVLLALILCLKDRKWKKLLHSVLAFIGGAAVLTLPFALYFILNGAVDDWIRSYFFNNIFSYTPTTQTEGKLPMILHYTQTALRTNLWGNFACFGFCWMLFGERKRVAFGTAAIVGAGAFFTYVGGIGWTYYGLALAWTVVPGVMLAAGGAEEAIRAVVSAVKETAIPKNVEKPRLRSGTPRILSGVLASLLLAVTVIACAGNARDKSPNTFYMAYERDEIWQKKFSDIILASDEPTVLNYSCLDLGVYTVSGVIPDEKFFCRLNIDLDEMNEGLQSAIKEKRPHYVVARSQPSAFLLSYYSIIERADAFLEFEGSEASYFLLERK